MVTQVYEIRSDFWGPFPFEIWRPKNIRFQRDFGQLRDLMAIISGNFGKQLDIVNLKTALQTADTPAQANLIRCSLVHKWQKIGPEF